MQDAIALLLVWALISMAFGIPTVAFSTGVSGSLARAGEKSTVDGRRHRRDKAAYLQARDKALAARTRWSIVLGCVSLVAVGVLLFQAVRASLNAPAVLGEIGDSWGWSALALFIATAVAVVCLAVAVASSNRRRVVAGLLAEPPWAGPAPGVEGTRHELGDMVG